MSCGNNHVNNITLNIVLKSGRYLFKRNKTYPNSVHIMQQRENGRLQLRKTELYMWTCKKLFHNATVPHTRGHQKQGLEDILKRSNYKLWGKIGWNWAGENFSLLLSQPLNNQLLEDVLPLVPARVVNPRHGEIM